VNDDQRPASILCVTAHPDDVDFGAAGTIAALTAAGTRVTYCIVTDGDAGALDAHADITALAAVRRDEQRRAAAQVGVDEVTFLGHPDGRVAVTTALRRDIAREIRRARPDVVIAQSPERNYARIRASHPDHLAAGEATLDAVYPDARNPYAHPELLADGFEPHVVGEVWLMAAPGGPVSSGWRTFDITTSIDRKIEALLCHASQVGSGDELGTTIRSWATATARDAGLGDGRLAEAFQVVHTA
jgi:LmbE family N-acetylglucosaminyl deacetylase